MEAQPMQAQAVAAQPQVVVIQQQGESEADANSSALMLFFVGWFCPFVWFFCFCKYYKSPYSTAKTLAFISLLFGVLFVGGIIVLIIVTATAVNTVTSASYYNYVYGR
jgi:hypothetical protein